MKMSLNAYSTGDEVFYETANPLWLLEGVLDSTANYTWQKQETREGFGGRGRGADGAR